MRDNGQNEIDTGLNSKSLIDFHDAYYDSVDIFAAGISGHSNKNYFGIFMCTPVDNSHTELSKALVLGLLLWLVPYLHHSVREIILPLFIYQTEMTDLKVATENLFNVRSTDSEMLFDKVFELLKINDSLFSEQLKNYQIKCKDPTIIKEYI
jgi:hypothetical protein